MNKSGKRIAKWDTINVARSRVRARGEHVFRVVKCSSFTLELRVLDGVGRTSSAYHDIAIDPYDTTFQCGP